MYKWIALATGFAMMAFELVAARLLAPTIGSSTFIWTNVIGVIMGALAIGYWWGGKLADKRKRELDIARLCLIIAGLVTIVLILHAPIIGIARDLSSDARWQGLLAALLLFAPTSVVIGMISPYLAKLAVKSTKDTGKTIAGLSTFNAIGSIAGTFVTGFFLFGLIGSRATLVVVICIMLVAGWLIQPRTRLWRRVIISIVLLLLVTLAVTPVEAITISIDTAISNYRVSKGTLGGRPVTYLHAGPSGIQSASYDTGEKDLVFWYTSEIAGVIETREPLDRILIIGGGAFSLPEYLGRKYPTAEVDVIEIDPELESIARQYFRFEKPSNVAVYAEDARSFINRIDDTRYDVIVVDAFSDTDIPWQFVTREFGDRATHLLTDHGIVIANIISATAPGCAKVFNAQIATYGQHLPRVYVKIKSPDDQKMTNFSVVFAHGSTALPDDYKAIDATSLRPYSDNYAPIEHLWQECLSAAR